MTSEQLLSFLDEHWCNCGLPEQAANFLLEVLNLHPLYEHRKELETLIPNTGIEYFVLYFLDSIKLTEHGGNVGGGWLTDLGKEVKKALEVEKSKDNFKSLFP